MISAEILISEQFRNNLRRRAIFKKREMLRAKKQKQETSDRNPNDDDFVTLLTIHQSELNGFMLSLMPGSPDYEDVLQNVNRVLWQNRERFETGTNFRAWMFKVARFQVMAWRKKKVRQSWLMFDDDLLDLIETEAREEADEDSLTALRQCLSKLGDAERDLVLRRYGDDFSINDYAAEHDQQPTKLRTLLFRIRAALRVCIERTLTTEAPI